MGERSRTIAHGIAGRGALLLIGLAAALTLSECVVRIAGVAPDVVVIQEGRFRLSKNPRIGFEPRPGVHYEGKALDLFGYRGSGNSLGYRDDEHSVETPDGVFRIVVLGDSIGVGLYVERRQETFPAATERLLRNGGIRAEVINLSVSGYNTQHEVETLRDRGLQYDPDLVLLAYCLNDRAPNDGGIMERLLDRETGSDGISWARVNSLWLIRSALYRFLRYSIFPPRRREASEHRKYHYEEVTRDTTEEYFHELARLARANGFRVLVVIFPELTNLTEYRYAGEHQRVIKISRECGFEGVRLRVPRSPSHLQVLRGGGRRRDRVRPLPSDASGASLLCRCDRHVHPGPDPEPAPLRRRGRRRRSFLRRIGAGAPEASRRPGTGARRRSRARGPSSRRPAADWPARRHGRGAPGLADPEGADNGTSPEGPSGPGPGFSPPGQPRGGLPAGFVVFISPEGSPHCFPSRGGCRGAPWA